MKKELILEIKASIEGLKGAIQEIQRELLSIKAELGLGKELKEAKEESRKLKKEVESIKGGDLLIDEELREARLHAQAIEKDLQEIKRIAGSIGSPFRRWLEDLENVMTIVYTLRELGGELASLSPFGRGISILRDLETNLIAIAASVYSIRNSSQGVAESIGKATDRAVSFEEALEEARKAQELLRIKGLQSVATYQELVNVFQGIVAPALSAGMSMDQVVELTVLAANAVRSMNLDMNQAVQEMRDLITGQIDMNSQIAKALGVNRQMVELARKQGNLYELITQKLEGFILAGERLQNTFAGALSNLMDAYDYVATVMAQPLFEVLKQDIQSLINNLFGLKVASSQTASSINEIISGGVVQRAREFGQSLLVIYSVLREFGKGVGEAFSTFLSYLQTSLEFAGALYETLKSIIDPLLRIGGYILTMAALFYLPLRLAVMLRGAFQYLLVVVRAVSTYFRGGLGLRELVTKIGTEFMRLGIFVKSLLLSVVSVVINTVHSTIKGFLDNLWASFLLLKALFIEGLISLAQKVPFLNFLVKPLTQELKETYTELGKLLSEEKKLSVNTEELEKLEEKLKEIEEKELKIEVETELKTEKSPLLEKVAGNFELEVQLKDENLRELEEKLLTEELKLPVELDTSLAEEQITEFMEKARSLKLGLSCSDFRPGWDRC